MQSLRPQGLTAAVLCPAFCPLGCDRFFCERDYLAAHLAGLNNVFHSDTDVVFQVCALVWWMAFPV
jgi:hypothetical protein